MGVEAKIIIEDFGPVEYGEIQLSKLTIFVGNNSIGKTYTAMVVHSIINLINAIKQRFFSQYYQTRLFNSEDKNIFEGPVEDDDLDKDVTILYPDSRYRIIDRILNSMLKKKGMHERINEIYQSIEDQGFKEVNVEAEEISSLIIKEITKIINRNLTEEIIRLFGANLKDLIKTGKNCFKLKIIAPMLDLEFLCDKDKISIEKMNIAIPKLTITKKKLKTKESFVITLSKTELAKETYRPIKAWESFYIDPKMKEPDILFNIGMVIFENYRQIFNSAFPYRVSRYLPATRSGLVQGYKVISASLVKLAPLAGLRPIEVPSLSGVVSDFISSLLEQNGWKHSKGLETLINFLENEILKGKIEIKNDAKHGYSEIYFITPNAQIPIHLTSSMISELATVDLYIRNIISKEDLLIIEEPEAHLHPGNVRLLAHLLVKMIRAGLHVLITTHSDILISQLNNFLSLERVSDKIRSSIGYDNNTYLKKDEINVFLFKIDKNDNESTITEKVLIDDSGINEETLSSIIRELYNETITIQDTENST